MEISILDASFLTLMLMLGLFGLGSVAGWLVGHFVLLPELPPFAGVAVILLAGMGGVVWMFVSDLHSSEIALPWAAIVAAIPLGSCVGAYCAWRALRE